MKLKRKKSKIPEPGYEVSQTMGQALTSMQNEPLYMPYWKLKVIHEGRKGLQRVIHQMVLDNDDVIEEVNYIENYIRDKFGSGEFQVRIYDYNDIERGRSTYNLGGAPEYIHPADRASNGTGYEQFGEEDVDRFVRHNMELINLIAKSLIGK